MTSWKPRRRTTSIDSLSFREPPFQAPEQSSVCSVEKWTFDSPSPTIGEWRRDVASVLSLGISRFVKCALPARHARLQERSSARESSKTGPPTAAKGPLAASVWMSVHVTSSADVRVSQATEVEIVGVNQPGIAVAETSKITFLPPRNEIESAVDEADPPSGLPSDWETCSSSRPFAGGCPDSGPIHRVDTSHNRLSSINEGIEFRLGADMKVAEALEEG